MSGRASGQNSCAASRRAAALDLSQKITHLLLDLEAWTSISLALARVKRAGEFLLIRRKNNLYFIGEREIIISVSCARSAIVAERRDPLE
jgi:hypothetical protein